MRNRRRYPKDWRKRAKACKEAAGWKCQHCGVQQRSTRISFWTGNVYVVFLQAAHINHDPENPDAELACVCPTCHWHYHRKPRIRAAWVALERMKHQRLIKLAWCL
jgi:predicted HNH restriction endonuclease